MKMRLNPIVDVLALMVGANIGYFEGKGMDVSKVTEYAILSAPTITSIITNSLGFFVAKYLTDFAKEAYQTKTIFPNAEIEFKGIKKEYQELTDTEKEEFNSLALQAINNTEKRLTPQMYLKSTSFIGSQVALETATGYVIGALASRVM